MNAKTPMTLDEVLAVMDAVAQFGHTPRETALHDEEIDQARATIAALQSAQAEEVAGLREELNDQCRLLASGVERELNFQLRAEQAEARLARVEADAKVLAYALSDNVAPHHLSHDVKCAIRKYVATTPTAGESHD